MAQLFSLGSKTPTKYEHINTTKSHKDIARTFGAVCIARRILDFDTFGYRYPLAELCSGHAEVCSGSHSFIFMLPIFAARQTQFAGDSFALVSRSCDRDLWRDILIRIVACDDSALMSMIFAA